MKDLNLKRIGFSPTNAFSRESFIVRINRLRKTCASQFRADCSAVARLVSSTPVFPTILIRRCGLPALFLICSVSSDAQAPPPPPPPEPVIQKLCQSYVHSLLSEIADKNILPDLRFPKGLPPRLNRARRLHLASELIQQRRLALSVNKWPRWEDLDDAWAQSIALLSSQKPIAAIANEHRRLFDKVHTAFEREIGEGSAFSNGDLLVDFAVLTWIIELERFRNRSMHRRSDVERVIYPIASMFSLGPEHSLRLLADPEALRNSETASALHRKLSALSVGNDLRAELFLTRGLWITFKVTQTSSKVFSGVLWHLMDGYFARMTHPFFADPAWLELSKNPRSRKFIEGIANRVFLASFSATKDGQLAVPKEKC